MTKKKKMEALGLTLTLTFGIAACNSVPKLTIPSTSKSKSQKSPKKKLPKLEKKNPQKSTPRNSKKVFLTFDDGPSVHNTANVVKTLNSFGVKATFFTIGKQVNRNPQLMSLLRKNSMSIQNHSYTG